MAQLSFLVCAIMQHEIDEDWVITTKQQNLGHWTVGLSEGVFVHVGTGVDSCLRRIE